MRAGAIDRVDAQCHAHPAERLRPSGAVHVPVELVESGVGEALDDIHLAVGDDVRLAAVHEGVVAESDAEEFFVELGRVRNGLPELVDDTFDGRVKLHAVPVLGDVAVEAAVLVELGVHRHDRLDDPQPRVAVGILRQHVVGVERLELEVVHVAFERLSRLPQGRPRARHRRLRRR